MLRQHSPLIHETKFFPNVRVASLYTHASGPFMPALASPFISSGARLQFFLDPTCARSGSTSDIAIELTVDIWASLGSLIMRYRMAAVAFPFSLVLLIFAKQLMDFNDGGRSDFFCFRSNTDTSLGAFVEFGSSFATFIRTLLLPLLGFLFATSIFQSIAMGTHLSSTELLNPAESRNYQHLSHPYAWLSDLLLGNQSASLSLLASFIVFLCVGVVAVEYLVLNGLVELGAYVVKFVRSKVPSSP